jgi:hypothetical protein
VRRGDSNAGSRAARVFAGARERPSVRRNSDSTDAEARSHLVRDDDRLAASAGMRKRGNRNVVERAIGDDEPPGTSESAAEPTTMRLSRWRAARAPARRARYQACRAASSTVARATRRW